MEQQLKQLKKLCPIQRSTATLACSGLPWSGGVQEKITDWERLLRAAAEIQQIVPKAILVGGTAAAIHAKHRFSFDANHVLPDLEKNFQALLDVIESNQDWQTQRVQPPKLILGRFMGVETGLRQLIRKKPLETVEIILEQKKIVVPTAEEMLRIKGWLALIRNALRDYIDLAALSFHLGEKGTIAALDTFNDCYKDIYRKDEVLPLLQLARQLAEPVPYDLEDIDIENYKGIVQPWDTWENIKKQCEEISSWIATMIAEKK